MYAIILTGGKQYRVAAGNVIKVEKLNTEAEEQFVFDKVLSVVKDGETTFGTPFVAGAKVTAKVLEQGRGKKIRIFKYKSKSNYRVRQGHRQPYTALRIEGIEM